MKEKDLIFFFVVVFIPEAKLVQLFPSLSKQERLR